MYRPRKQRKRSRKSLAPVHFAELQALVIRLKKVFIQVPPTIVRSSTEIFLDIESIPDQDFYYLFGAILKKGEDDAYYYYWANSVKDERTEWARFINFLNTYPEAPIYHYGSLEQNALESLGKRYDTDVAIYIDRLENINKHIYGKIYFPLKSNNLKEIGQYIGISWTSPGATGLKSIVWRMNWEVCNKNRSELKKRIIQYNRDDCSALEHLTEYLSTIDKEKRTITNVERYVHSKKPISSKSRNPLHHRLEQILKHGHANYNKNNITFSSLSENSSFSKTKSIKGKRPREIKNITKIVEVKNEVQCPFCKSEKTSPTNKRERIEIDLDFTNNSVCKEVIKYCFNVRQCNDCKHKFSPEKFRLPGAPKKYGYGFKVWIAYQRVALRQSYGNIKLITNELFHEQFCDKAIILYLKEMGDKYSGIEKLFLSKLLESPVLHVDDTQVNIDHINKYVWVFTDGKIVYYLQTESREASFLQDLLSEFKGILVTDFYAGFDKLACKHQKCLAHIVRDLNNDLWRSPFDKEFEKFVYNFSLIITSIMKTVSKHGLKKNSLAKFKERIKKYYQVHVIDKSYKSANSLKYQKRFKKYWNSFFTFIDHDDVPWHNNIAENALRQITIQQDISRRFSKSTIQSYLNLLSIKQTCKFQEKSFLDVLQSTDTSINTFDNMIH